MRIRSLAAAAMVSVLVLPSVALADSFGVVLTSDDNHAQLNTDPDKDNVQTRSITLTNLTTDDIPIQVASGDPADSEIAADPKFLAKRRTQTVKLTFTDCGTDKKKATFSVTAATDATAVVFSGLAADPSAEPDPDWLAIVMIYAVTLAVSIVLLWLAWLSWKSPYKDETPASITPGKADEYPEPRTPWMTLPGLEASWKFSDSWAANATVITAAFTALFGAKDVTTALLGNHATH